MNTIAPARVESEPIQLLCSGGAKMKPICAYGSVTDVLLEMPL